MVRFVLWLMAIIILYMILIVLARDIEESDKEKEESEDERFTKDFITANVLTQLNKEKVGKLWSCVNEVYFNFEGTIFYATPKMFYVDDLNSILEMWETNEYYDTMLIITDIDFFDKITYMFKIFDTTIEAILTDIAAQQVNS